ncbi:MAG: DUF2116 family Zn-ribbon domain-containing protein [Ruminococcaceae bacterium]|nr:DUF2116 family Zn-ribbon domain-containing protein [Oscillospiraceae bacterium]
MYCCTDCKKEFEFVEVVFESHGLDTPPYERRHRCPFCHSGNFFELPDNHCRFCGSKMEKEGDYCSERCRVAGESYFEKQRKSREIFASSPVAKAVREIAEYNKKNGTKYSYGQYFSLKGEGKI